jgi:hypothetical protein
LDELDFWTSYDNPDNTSEQPLRAPGCNPFQPLSAPIDSDFDPSDPKNWWRGLGCDLNKKEYGVYGTFSRIDHPLSERSRLPIFYRKMVDGLGYYALCDYAPADFIYTYYDENKDVPGEFFDRIPFDAGHRPGDFMMLLDDHAFTLTRDPVYLANGINQRRLQIWDGFTGSQGELYHIFNPISLLQDRPENWPSLEAQIRHFTAAGRQWHTATILVKSPITGAQQKLYFSTTATTLRGARMQRKRTGGWAAPGDPTLDG